MLEIQPDYMSKVDSSLWGQNLIQQEMAIYDMSHVDVGGELCNLWFMPDTLYQTLSHYHEPQHAGDLRALASVIHVANALAAKDSSVVQSESCHAALKFLGLNAEQANP